VRASETFTDIFHIPPASLEGELRHLEKAKTAEAARQSGKTLLFGQGLRYKNLSHLLEVLMGDNRGGLFKMMVL